MDDNTRKEIVRELDLDYEKTTKAASASLCSQRRRHPSARTSSMDITLGFTPRCCNTPTTSKPSCPVTMPSLAELRDARPRLVVVVVCGTLRRRLRHLHLLFLKESRR